MKMIVSMLIVFGMNMIKVNAQVYQSEKLEICTWDSIQQNWVDCNISAGQVIITLDEINNIWSINDGVVPLVVSFNEKLPYADLTNTFKYLCSGIDIYYNVNEVIVVISDEKNFYRITYYI